MEIKLDENKQVLAKRVKLEKKEEKFYRVAGISSIVLASLFFIVSMFFIINIFFDSDIYFAICGVTLLVFAGLLGLYAGLSLKKYGKQVKTATYPPEAVILDGDKLLVVTNEITEIKISDIKSVHAKPFFKMNYFYYTFYDYGDLKIKLKDKKGTISLMNIADVANTCAVIKSVLKK